VEELLKKVATRTVRLLRRRGLLDEEAFPEDGLQACQAASLRQRLPLLPVEEKSVRRSARSAFLEGFSLHANTQIHENDRTGWRGCVVTVPEAL
jgi:hypothetical protein